MWSQDSYNTIKVSSWGYGTLLSRMRWPTSAARCLSTMMISSLVTLRCLPPMWTTANNRPVSWDISCVFTRSATVGNTHRQTDRHTDTQTDRQTHRQTYIHTYRHTDKQTHRQTYIHTDRQTDRHTDIHTDTQTDTQRDIHTYTHTHTQTDIHTYIQTDRHRDKHSDYCIPIHHLNWFHDSFWIYQFESEKLSIWFVLLSCYIWQLSWRLMMMEWTIHDCNWYSRL